MKKLSLLLTFIVLSTFTYAQWEVGPRIGVNFSTISGKYSENDNDQHKWITGLVAGGFATYNLNEMFSLSGELLYISSGKKTIYDVYDEGGRAINATQGQWTEKYSNIELPLFFRFTFGEDIQFYAEAGPYLMLSLCGKYTDVVESWNYDQSGKIKFGDEPDGYTGDDWYLDSDNYRRFDIGGYVGIGAQKKLGPGSLSFDFRFGRGFLDTYKWLDRDDIPDGYRPYKNRNISLSFGYTIPIGEK